MLGASGLVVLIAGFGAFVAARQSFLQWNPPEIVTCGRDFYGMIETFPLKRALPMIFRGGGDCSKIDWTLFGLPLNSNVAYYSGASLALSGMLLFMRSMLQTARLLPRVDRWCSRRCSCCRTASRQSLSRRPAAGCRGWVRACWLRSSSHWRVDAGRARSSPWQMPAASQRQVRQASAPIC